MTLFIDTRMLCFLRGRPAQICKESPFKIDYFLLYYRILCYYKIRNTSVFKICRTRSSHVISILKSNTHIIKQAIIQFLKSAVRGRLTQICTWPVSSGNGTCMYVCMCVCMCMYDLFMSCELWYWNLHVCMHVCIYVCMCVHMHVRAHLT
jgi:hypothetical protein